MMMLLGPAVWWIISTSNLAMVTPPEEIRRWTTPLFSADISTALPLDAPHLLDTLESSLAALRSDPREALGVRKSNRDGGWHSNELLAPEMYSEFGGPGSLSLLCAVADLHDALVDAVERTPLRRAPKGGSDVLVQNMWANANGASHTNVVHNHPDAAISGVLYLNTAAAELSEDTLSGVLALADPRLAPQCAGSGDPNVPSPAQVLRRKSLFMLCAWCDGDQLNQCSSSPAGELATTLRPGIGGRSDVMITPSRGSLYLWPAFLPHSVLAHRNHSAERLSISFNLYRPGVYPSAREHAMRASYDGGGARGRLFTPSQLAQQRTRVGSFMEAADSLCGSRKADASGAALQRAREKRARALQEVREPLQTASGGDVDILGSFGALKRLNLFGSPLAEFEMSAVDRVGLLSHFADLFEKSDRTVVTAGLIRNEVNAWTSFDIFSNRFDEEQHQSSGNGDDVEDKLTHLEVLRADISAIVMNATRMLDGALEAAACTNGGTASTASAPGGASEQFCTAAASSMAPSTAERRRERNSTTTIPRNTTENWPKIHAFVSARCGRPATGQRRSPVPALRSRNAMSRSTLVGALVLSEGLVSVGHVRVTPAALDFFDPRGPAASPLWGDENSVVRWPLRAGLAAMYPAFMHASVAVVEPGVAPRDAAAASNELMRKDHRKKGDEVGGGVEAIERDTTQRIAQLACGRGHTTAQVMLWFFTD